MQSQTLNFHLGIPERVNVGNKGLELHLWDNLVSTKVHKNLRVMWGIRSER